MTRDRWIAILTAFAVVALPALSLADQNKAGGKAEEHRSEKAVENSNAQWDDDNDGRSDRLRRGHDDEADDNHGRSDRLRRDHDDEDDDHDKDKREKRDKKGKKSKKDRKGSDSDD